MTGYEDYIFEVSPSPTEKIVSTEGNTLAQKWLKQLNYKIEREKDSAFYYFDTAHIYQQIGKYDEALAACRQGLEQSKCGFGLYRLASIEFDMGDWRASSKHASEALNLFPDNSEILLLRMFAQKKGYQTYLEAQDELLILDGMEKKLDKRLALLKACISADSEVPTESPADQFKPEEVNSYYFQSNSAR